MYLRNNFIAAVSVTAIIMALYSFDLVRHLPGMHCESFGCMGLGVFLAMLVVLVPCLFFIVNLLVVREKRWKKSGIAFLIALVCMVVGVGAYSIVKQRKVAHYQAIACKEDPATYCPHTLQSPPAQP